MTSPQPQDWITAWARIQRLADTEVLRMLETATVDIRRQIRILEARSKGAIGETVRVYQLKVIEQNMLREQALIYKKLGDSITARRFQAAAAAISLNNQVLEDLFRSAGQTALGAQLAQTIEVGLLGSIDVAVARVTQSAMTLAQHIYNTDLWTSGRIQNGINSALARGLSAREFAAEAVNWFDPRTPGGARYASMRLARSEINNAFHAMSVNSADHPWVHGMKWHLSGSHPKPDICDDYAHQDPDNLGAGVYKVRNVPRKPHPHCFCYVTPVVEDEDAFLDNLVAGHYDSHISEVLTGQVPKRSPLPSAPKKASPRTVQAEKDQLKLKREAEAKAQKEAKEKAAQIKREQLAASPAGRRAAARLHTDNIVDRDIRFNPSLQRSIKDAMHDSANAAPESMLRLRMLHDTEDAMWVQSGGPSVGGFYTYGGHVYNMTHNDIHLNPDWHRNFDSISRAFLKSQENGWLTATYPDDAARATIIHELGHHIDKMATFGTGEWPALVGEELSYQLGRLIGGVGPDVAQGGRILPGAMVRWVQANQKMIEKKVSRYAAKSPQELMAEIWAAFASGNPKTSPIMKRIGELMKRAAEEASRKK